MIINFYFDKPKTPCYNMVKNKVKSMALTYSDEKMEKVTFNMPSELKAKLVMLKEEMHVSFSALYNEALERFVKEKELEKWEKGAQKASKDKAYIRLADELGKDDGALYEY